jgi:transposase
MNLPLSTHVFLVLGVTDMRKAIDGLSVLIADQLDLDPLSGGLFAFCNRSRRIIKILYWDRNGFCLWQKRLEKHVFPWPASEAEVMRVGSRELAWLLDGLDLQQVQAHSKLGYSTLV